MFEIVAHRGCPDTVPENSIPAFLRALEFGADAVELDVRLTRDGALVVYHYFYLDKITNLSGPIFRHTWDEIRQARFQGRAEPVIQIPLLDQVLDALSGKIGLEVEIKGPESGSVETLVSVLKNHPRAWKNLEITSYEPMLLRQFQRLMPGVPTDLLIPRSEPWMGLDVVAYTALHRGRMAGARAVHLHPSQLDCETVGLIRSGGMEVHAWDVNDHASSITVGEGYGRKEFGLMGTEGVIRVFLADDHPLLRTGLRLSFHEENDIRIIGEAENGFSTVEKIKSNPPDVALIDVDMPGLSGIPSFVFCAGPSWR